MDRIGAMDIPVDGHMAGTPPAVPSRASDDVPAPRALIVTFGSVLDPRGGWAVRARSLAEALAGLGVRIAVISHEEPPGDPPPSIEAVHILRKRLRLGWSRELLREARRRSSDADVIIVESALLLPAVCAGRPEAPIIWDTTECETLHYSRLEPTLNNRLRLLVWREIERWAVKQTDVIVAISEAEADWWTRLFPGSSRKLALIPHQSLARPIPHDVARPHLEALCSRTLRSPSLLFVGNLAAKHNNAAADWLLRELAPRLPGGCALLLAGPGTEELSLPGYVPAQVECLGSVPDIDAVIAGSDVCLAPLAAGAGVKTKILDYLAHGKIVLATPVAMEGLEGAPGVRTADLDQFTPLVLSYLSNPDSDSDASQRAIRQRAWVDGRHGRERVAGLLQDALERVGVQIR